MLNLPDLPEHRVLRRIDLLEVEARLPGEHQPPDPGPHTPLR